MYSKDYSPQEINGQMHVWLQSWGWQQAKLGDKIQVGDILMYNFGYRATVIEIKKETPKTKTLVMREEKYGDCDQRIKKTTWWAIAD